MNYLTEAGPLVWLVMLLGAVALVAAVQYARSPCRRHLSLALGAAAASVVMATLATVLGFQKSVGGLGDVAADDRWIYLVGLQEGLNNVVIALVFAFLISLLLTIGALRRATAG